MNWTKISDKTLPDYYTTLLIKWQSKSTSFEFITTGFLDDNGFWHSTSTDLIVTDDLVAVEWMEAK